MFPQTSLFCIFSHFFPPPLSLGDLNNSHNFSLPQSKMINTFISQTVLSSRTSEIQSKLNWMHHLKLYIFKVPQAPSSPKLLLLLLPYLPRLMKEHNMLPRQGSSRSSLTFQRVLNAVSSISRCFEFYMRKIMWLSLKSFEAFFFFPVKS